LDKKIIFFTFIILGGKTDDLKHQTCEKKILIFFFYFILHKKAIGAMVLASALEYIGALLLLT